MLLRGMEVRDALQSTNLIIKKVDVTRASPKDPSKCAIARACKRGMKVEECLVHLTRVYVRNSGEEYWVRFELPRALRTEVIAFDRGGSAFPNEEIWELRAPTPSQKLGTKRAEKSGPGTTTRRAPMHVTQGVRITAREQY